MLKSGDKVVCINNINDKDLIIGNIYTISLHAPESVNFPEIYPAMYILKEVSFFQLPSNFCTLNEYRRQKLKNLELC